MYVLQRVEDGKFVARSGSKDSYTRDLQKAQVYTTKESAEKNVGGFRQGMA